MPDKSAQWFRNHIALALAVALGLLFLCPTPVYAMHIAEGTPGEVFADADMIREVELRLPRISHLIEILQKKEGIHFQGLPLTIGEARRELLRFVGAGRQTAVEPRYREGASYDGEAKR